MTIEFDQVTKRYRSTVAVDSLTCTIPAGAVTGLLGPNGAGKSTAMRVLAGLERPTAGRATIAGRAYIDRIAPLREVGMMFDSAGLHPRDSDSHRRAQALPGGGRVGELTRLIDAALRG